jgi:hypothetical protein
MTLVAKTSGSTGDIVRFTDSINGLIHTCYVYVGKGISCVR